MSMSNTEKYAKEIRCKTRRKFSSEEKIKIIEEFDTLSLIHSREEEGSGHPESQNTQYLDPIVRFLLPTL